MIKKYSFISTLYFIFATTIISIFVSLRDITTVEDNIHYINNFLSTTSFQDFNYEPFFDLLTLVIRYFTDNYIIYFFILNIILNSIIFYTAIKIVRFYKLKIEFYIPLLISFLLLSSWYYTLATNGLRQGLSLSIFYLALIELRMYRKLAKSLVLIISACLFHYSTILTLPFLFLYKLNTNRLFIVACIIAAGYILGLNEDVVQIISNMLNIPLYDLIKTYVDDTEAYRYGFQPDLFIYTFGLSCLYFLSRKFISTRIENFDLMVKTYIILTLPYYIFGFAAFSNRYGITAWLFSIFMNITITYLLLERQKKIFYLIFIIVFFVSLLQFLNRYTYFI